jgi:GT2 family glycosyltransferase
MNKNNFLSAVILGYGNFDETSKKCLDSLIDEAKENNMALLAVDNGSPDDSALKLTNYQKAHPSLEVQINLENLGFGGGMNHAINQLHTEWVLLVNSDIIFPPKSLSRLINSLRNCPNEFGIVAPLTNNAGNEQCIYIPGLSTENIIKNSSAIIDNPCGIMTPAYRADFCCVAIKTELWRKLNGLDNKYGKGYYEDFDFSLRAREIGYQCAVSEDSFVYHHGSLSFKANPTQKALIHKNKFILLGRHPEAKLHHQRECNWSAINFYATQKPTSAIQIRLNLRLELMKKIMPKSFFKKLGWQKKIKNIEHYYSSVNFITTQI